MGHPSKPCVIHGRTNCESYTCRLDGSNANLVSLNTEGHLALGLGNGLVIDATDGSLGIQVGDGLALDLG